MNRHITLFHAPNTRSAGARVLLEELAADYLLHTVDIKQRIAMHDGGHLAHWIDSQVGRIALFDIDRMQHVVRCQFFQQYPGAGRAFAGVAGRRGRRGIRRRRF